MRKVQRFPFLNMPARSPDARSNGDVKSSANGGGEKETSYCHPTRLGCSTKVA
jgi:hypothetical protein